MKIIEPQTPQEFEAYYLLRWQCLREPWQMPKGSEKDDLENVSIHAMLVDGSNKPLAVGRLHLNKGAEAQIRYMAVDVAYRGKKYGNKILSYLEKKAKEKNTKTIVLQARENAVNFYQRNGYSIIEKTFLLWGKIQHYLMLKKI